MSACLSGLERELKVAPAGSIFEFRGFYNNGGERIMVKTKALQDKGLFVLVDSSVVNAQPGLRTCDAGRAMMSLQKIQGLRLCI